MSIAFLVFGCFAILFGTGCWVFDNFKWLFIAGVILTIWSAASIIAHDPAPVVTRHTIEILDDENIYYRGTDSSKPIFLTGDSRFVDVKTTEVEWTTWDGAWKFGLYNPTQMEIKLVKKTQAEAK